MKKLISVRAFNDSGLNEFEKYILEIKNENIHSIPDDFLYDDTFSSVLEPVINIEQIDYKNKNELIPYIVEMLELLSNKQFYFNKGLWSWLGAFYFDNICPADVAGKRKVNEPAFYLLRDPKNYTKFYRHLLAYPSRIYTEIGDSSKIFLIGSFLKRGEITEQFGAYQEIALNKSILDAACLMYWDNSTNNLKRGAAGKGAGSARRLVRIIRQYQLTYDLNSMRGDEIALLMPNEFSKWLHKGI